jgi:hypothetical protein
MYYAKSETPPVQGAFRIFASLLSRNNSGLAVKKHSAFEVQLLNTRGQEVINKYDRCENEQSVNETTTDVSEQTYDPKS